MKSRSRAQQTPHIEVQVPKGVNQLGASLMVPVEPLPILFHNDHTCPTAPSCLVISILAITWNHRSLRVTTKLAVDNHSAGLEVVPLAYRALSKFSQDLTHRFYI
jgi:hypothetical protein